MTVVRMRALFSCVCLCTSVQAQGQTRTDAVDYPLGRYNAQLGVDVWQFESDKPEKLLMMATNTQWRYKPVSPWATFDGRLMLSSLATVSLKARANQEMGSHVDELSADLAVSPSFGVKAGVLDYKTSWCRTYDIDSPWVRENDPFCTVVSTSGPSGGAPGLQAYVNLPIGNYRVQSIVGVYSPLAFNYNTTEFSNASYKLSHVTKNQKQGASISALNLDTATEFRVGVLQAQQALSAYESWNEPVFQVEQAYELVFAGVSFYVAPKLNIRMQTLRHARVNKEISNPNVDGPHVRRGDNLKRSSQVVEFNYQLTAEDLIGVAFSKYLYNATLTETNYPLGGYTVYPDYYVYAQKAMSVAWRHDWSRGIFTVLQLTQSQLALNDRLTNIDRTAKATGLGMRLAYQF
jgi:hypothetical protein